jgi:hypothetical protein
MAELCPVLRVGTPLSVHHPRQVQGNFLDESHLGTHQPIELRAVGQRRKGILEVALRVAVEVPFTSEAGEETARVSTSLWEGEASGPGRCSVGGWEWQKSSTR